MALGLNHAYMLIKLRYNIMCLYVQLDRWREIYYNCKLELDDLSPLIWEAARKVLTTRKTFLEKAKAVFDISSTWNYWGWWIWLILLRSCRSSWTSCWRAWRTCRSVGQNIKKDIYFLLYHVEYILLIYPLVFRKGKEKT